jgi:cell division protease FtsH
MSDKVGNVSYYDSSGQSDYSFNKPYSEKTSELIDAEIKELIDTAFTRAKDILIKNAKGHKQLAELLLEREVIFTEDMENIFGQRPWGKKKDDENPLKDDDTQPTNLESEITKG